MTFIPVPDPDRPPHYREHRGGPDGVSGERAEVLWHDAITDVGRRAAATYEAGRQADAAYRATHPGAAGPAWSSVRDAYRDADPARVAAAWSRAREDARSCRPA